MLSPVHPRLLLPVAEVSSEAGGSYGREPAGGGSLEGTVVDVVALTADLDLFAATREAIGEQHRAWRAGSAEEAADLLITGRCGVLLVDLACVSTRGDTLVTQIAEQFPDVVICVAGTRLDEPLLVPLISAGLVHRFMHKPASPRRARMFLQSAMRRHVERREGAPDSSPTSLLHALPMPRAGLPRKYLAGIALLALVLTGALFMDGGRDGVFSTGPMTSLEPPTDAVPSPADTVVQDAVTGTSLASSSDAVVPRADPVLSRARAALQAGRYEAPQGRNALDLYAAVLLAQPGHAEARAGLDRTAAAVLQQARGHFTAGRPEEAARLAQRILGVAPKHEAALALLRELEPPPDSPSQQLAREEAALAAASLAPQAPSTTPAALSSHAPLPTNVPVTRLSPPEVKSPPRREPPPVVRPDPLQPRIANASSGTTLSRPRTYGGRVANPLPIAGYVATPATPPVDANAVDLPAHAPAVADLLRVPSDELDRVSARDPVYPPEALRNGTRGWVELEFTVTPTGTVRDVAVVGAEPLGVFEGAAREALEQWRFRPRVVNGRAVAQRSSLTIRFDLDG